MKYRENKIKCVYVFIIKFLLIYCVFSENIVYSFGFYLAMEHLIGW